MEINPLYGSEDKLFRLGTYFETDTSWRDLFWVRRIEEEVKDGVLPNFAFSFNSNVKITKIVIMNNDTKRKYYGVTISPDHMFDLDLLALPESIWEGNLDQIEDITLSEATLSRSVVIWRDDFVIRDAD